MTIANVEGAEFWEGLASTWVELEDRLELVSGPPGDCAMDRLALQRGEQVLDLGCGTGRTTVRLAGKVAPDGRAVGLDISEGMLDRAREHAAAAGADNVEFVRGDAQVHVLGEGAFDAAYSRFGVMFFAEPVPAFANVKKALRPGGRLSFVCWQSALLNEWMSVPAAAAIAATGVTPSMPGPDEPGPFSLADADRVRSILEKAEFADIEVVPRTDTVVTEEARIPEISRISTRVGVVRELLREADGEAHSRVLNAIEAAWRERLSDGAVRASRAVHLVTARA